MSKTVHETEGAPLRIGVVAEGIDARLVMSGEFDLSNLETAQAGLTEALAGEGEVVVDLTQLTFIDSTAIAFFIGISRNDARGRIEFIPSESAAVRRVLQITGVDEMLGGGNGAEPS